MYEEKQSAVSEEGWTGLIVPTNSVEGKRRVQTQGYATMTR